MTDAAFNPKRKGHKSAKDNYDRGFRDGVAEGRRLNAGEPRCETCHSSEKGATVCSNPWHHQRDPGEPAKPRCPDGYAYRYPDGIRFNNAQEVNGSKPLEGIPYYFGTTPAGRQDGWVSVAAEKICNFVANVIKGASEGRDTLRISQLCVENIIKQEYTLPAPPSAPQRKEKA